ncbi:nucleotidyltransferase family protein [Candidatus Pelagibacter sp. HIMB1587]|uniref:nucleotidyltransferase family protein n=1 Tax=Candidatus Pelagibacter sp. HIMB1587 TaxID=3413354 RepID=UPI003F827DED
MKYRTAIVLCGGKGTRLGQIGKKFPKTLIKVQGKSILYYILNSLKKNKFNHIILPTGYRGKQIKEFIKSSKFKNLKIEVVNTGVNTTIAQRIYKIKRLIKSENFLILNGDAIFDTNLNRIFKKHEIKKKDMSLICCDSEADFGTVGVINNKVVNFERNLNFNSVNIKMKNFKGYVYSGMCIFNKRILMENFKNCFNFEKEFYPKLIKKYEIDFHTLKGFWYAVDNIKHLDTLNKKDIIKKNYLDIYKFKQKINDK